MSGTAETRGRHLSKKRALIAGNLGFTDDNKHRLIREVTGIYGNDPKKDRSGLIGGFRPVLVSGEEGWEIDRLDEPVGIIDFLRLQPRLIVESYARRTQSLGRKPFNSDLPMLINLDEAREVREEQKTAWLELAFLEGRQEMIDKILKDDGSLDVNWVSRS